jgi:hypothetical protein
MCRRGTIARKMEFNTTCKPVNFKKSTTYISVVRIFES